MEDLQSLQELVVCNNNKIDEWIHEDIPSFDYAGLIVGSKSSKAVLLCKSPGVIAGFPFLNQIFDRLGCQVEWLVKEGKLLDGNRNKCAIIKGPANKLLQGERTSLNLLCRLSGIATRSYELKKLVQQVNPSCILAGTRKTTPGLRIPEKYAMLVGGVDMHRHDLSSMVMLKDNHISLAGSISAAVKQARQVAGISLKIEVEVCSEAQAEEAIKAGADIVMLDNFTYQDLIAVSRNLKQKWGPKYNFLLECSGGLDKDNLSKYLSPNIDIYSTSKIHQGTEIVDFSLKVDNLSS